MIIYLSDDIGICYKNYEKLKRRGIGIERNNALLLNLYEILYAVENYRAKVLKGSKEVLYEEIIKHAENSVKNFYIKYLVFKDLMNRGFLVKSGYKFGFDFRIYVRNEEHSKYLVKVFYEESDMKLSEISSMIRLATFSRKIPIIAVVDKDFSINYFKILREI